MPPQPLTRTTRLCQLLPSVSFKLRTNLDCDNKWKELAATIVNKRGQPKYNMEDVMSFELEFHKGRSPTEALLRDWGHDNTTVQDLLKVLWEIQHCDLMHFLLVKCMKEMTEDEFCNQLEKGWEGVEHKYVIKSKVAEEFVESRAVETMESTERNTVGAANAGGNTEETVNADMNTEDTVNVERNTEEAVNATSNTEDTVNAERNTEETVNVERNGEETVNADMNTEETMNAEKNREETVNAAEKIKCNTEALDAERNTVEKERVGRNLTETVERSERNKAGTAVPMERNAVGFAEEFQMNTADGLELDAKNDAAAKMEIVEKIAEKNQNHHFQKQPSLQQRE